MSLKKRIIILFYNFCAVKISEIESNNSILTPLVLGAFFSYWNISPDKKIFYTYSKNRINSKFVSRAWNFLESKKEFFDNLNKYSKPLKWTNKKQKQVWEFCCEIENDLSWSKDEFYNFIFKTILNNKDFIKPDLNNNKKMFLRGFFELRGSPDPNLNYLSIDCFPSNKFQMNRSSYIHSLFDVPLGNLNFNPRELQKQHVENTNKRNAQIRINLSWYSKCVGFINKYKAFITEGGNSISYGKHKKTNGFYFFPDAIKRNTQPKVSYGDKLEKYVNNILGKRLTKAEIKKLRSDYGFDYSDEDFSRNPELPTYIMLNRPDECECCKTIYNINDRSFPWRKHNGRPYFEIHHFISIGPHRELDVPENLVKICPVCHKALKKSVGTEKIQRNYIKNILHNNDEVKMFSMNYFGTSDENNLIEKIYQNLR